MVVISHDRMSDTQGSAYGAEAFSCIPTPHDLRVRKIDAVTYALRATGVQRPVMVSNNGVPTVVDNARNQPKVG